MVPAFGVVLFFSRGKLISQPLNLEDSGLELRANIIAEAVDYDPGIWMRDLLPRRRS